MEVTFTVTDPDIIAYINNITTDRDKILSDAMCIGIKCMENIKLDTSSYSDNIIKHFDNSNEEIKEMINGVFLGMKTPAKKGAVGENVSATQISRFYPPFDVNVVSSEGKQGDIHVLTITRGNHKIMVENKVYDKNVNLVEVDKFKRDMVHSNFKYGIFHSATSGIVGKKNNIEWEEYKGKILVYVSNMGLPGAGCILGIELMLALINADVLNNTHNFFYENFELSKYQEIIKLSIDNIKEIGDKFIKFTEIIKEEEAKSIKSWNRLKEQSFDISCEYNRTIKDILKDIDINIVKKQIVDFHIDEFINSIDETKLKTIYTQLIHMIEQSSNTQYTIDRIDDDLLLINKDNEDNKYIIKKKRKYCEIRCPINNDCDEVVYNRKFSKATNSEIIIEIKESNCDLFDYVKKKLNL